MFAYCENNPVNGSDPTGCGGIGLMSDWNPQEYFHSNTRETHCDDIYIKALFYSTEISIGVGMGTKASVDIGDCEVNAGYAHNVAEVYLEDGKIGVRQTERYGVSADFHLFEFGFGRENYKDMNFNELPSEDNWDVFRYKIPDTLFSAEVYLYIGASVRIGISWEKFYEYLATH